MDAVITNAKDLSGYLSLVKIHNTQTLGADSYGIISIVGPTSIILIVCLTYLDVPYTTWLKYIWRFILYLVVLLALVVLLTIFL